MRTYVRFSTVGFTLILVSLVAVVVSNGMSRPAEAISSPTDCELCEPLAQRWFALYAGIEGGSTRDPNHDKWIDVLSIDWGSHKPGGGATGQSRRRGTVIVEDMRLTMEHDIASVALLEKLNLGEVIPKLEIEQTANYGGSRATYLKYELTNVQVTSIDFNAAANDESPPSVTIANNFEEYKVTYTKYDSEGNKAGNAETTWKVEKGEK
jgi:type VI secretion system secreted protein Hcp